MEETVIEVRADDKPSVELETLIVRLASAEAQAAALVAEVDQERAARSAAEDTLRQAEALLQETQSERAAQQQRSAEIAGRYRAAVLAVTPDVPPDLVAGSTIEEIDRSLATARATVDAVRQRMAERAAAERVPAGSPARGAADLSALTPREKIALALAGPRARLAAGAVARNRRTPDV